MRNVAKLATIAAGAVVAGGTALLLKDRIVSSGGDARGCSPNNPLPHPGSAAEAGRIQRVGDRFKRLWPEVTGEGEMPPAALEIALAQAFLESGIAEAGGGGWWKDKSGDGTGAGNMVGSGNLGARQCNVNDAGGNYYTCVEYGDSAPNADGTQTFFPARFRYYQAGVIGGKQRDAGDVAAYEFLYDITHQWPALAELKSGDVLAYAIRQGPRYRSADPPEQKVFGREYKGGNGYYGGFGATMQDRVGGYGRAIVSHLPAIAAALGHKKIFACIAPELLTGGATHAAVSGGCCGAPDPADIVLVHALADNPYDTDDATRGAEANIEGAAAVATTIAAAVIAAGAGALVQHHLSDKDKKKGVIIHVPKEMVDAARKKAKKPAPPHATPPLDDDRGSLIALATSVPIPGASELTQRLQREAEFAAQQSKVADLPGTSRDPSGRLWYAKPTPAAIAMLTQNPASGSGSTSTETSDSLDFATATPEEAARRTFQGVEGLGTVALVIAALAAGGVYAGKKVVEMATDDMVQALRRNGVDVVSPGAEPARGYARIAYSDPSVRAALAEFDALSKSDAGKHVLQVLSDRGFGLQKKSETLATGEQAAEVLASPQAQAATAAMSRAATIHGSADWWSYWAALRVPGESGKTTVSAGPDVPDNAAALLAADSVAVYAWSSISNLIWRDHTDASGAYRAKTLYDIHRPEIGDATDLATPCDIEGIVTGIAAGLASAMVTTGLGKIAETAVENRDNLAKARRVVSSMRSAGVDIVPPNKTPTPGWTVVGANDSQVVSSLAFLGEEKRGEVMHSLVAAGFRFQKRQGEHDAATIQGNECGKGDMCSEDKRTGCYYCGASYCVGRCLGRPCCNCGQPWYGPSVGDIAQKHVAGDDVSTARSTRNPFCECPSCDMNYPHIHAVCPEPKLAGERDVTPEAAAASDAYATSQVAGIEGAGTVAAAIVASSLVAGAAAAIALSRPKKEPPSPSGVPAPVAQSAKEPHYASPAGFVSMAAKSAEAPVPSTAQSPVAEADAKADAKARAAWTPQAQAALEACIKKPGADLISCSTDPRVTASLKKVQGPSVEGAGTVAAVVAGGLVAGAAAAIALSRSKTPETAPAAPAPVAAPAPAPTPTPKPQAPKKPTAAQQETQIADAFLQKAKDDLSRHLSAPPAPGQESPYQEETQRLVAAVEDAKMRAAMAPVSGVLGSVGIVEEYDAETGHGLIGPLDGSATVHFNGAAEVGEFVTFEPVDADQSPSILGTGQSLRALHLAGALPRARAIPGSSGRLVWYLAPPQAPSDVEGCPCLHGERFTRVTRVLPVGAPSDRAISVEGFSPVASALAAFGSGTVVGASAVLLAHKFASSPKETPTITPEPPPPIAPPPAPRPRTYVVKAGDSPFKIAVLHGANKRPAWWTELSKANPQKETVSVGRGWKQLLPDETIIIPREWPAASIEGATHIGAKDDEPDDADKALATASDATDAVSSLVNAIAKGKRAVERQVKEQDPQCRKLIRAWVEKHPLLARFTSPDLRTLAGIGEADTASFVDRYADEFARQYDDACEPTPEQDRTVIGTLMAPLGLSRDQEDAIYTASSRGAGTLLDMYAPGAGQGAEQAADAISQLITGRKMAPGAKTKPAKRGPHVDAAHAAQVQLAAERAKSAHRDVLVNEFVERHPHIVKWFKPDLRKAQ